VDQDQQELFDQDNETVATLSYLYPGASWWSRRWKIITTEERRGEEGRERGEGERERGVVRRTEPNPNSVLLSLQEEESFSTIFEGYMTENYVRSFVFETYISLVNESKSRCWNREV
jgi:hypothetical protein